MDVIFFEAFDEEEKALRHFLPKNVRAKFTPYTIQEERLKAVPAGVISIRTQSVIPKKWASSLKGVLTRSTGYDHILATRRETGLTAVCGCLVDYCSRSVAEQALLMAMALLRKLRSQQKHFERFDRNGLTGADVYGKNILVVGVGYIGRHVVDISRGLKAKVKGVDIKFSLKDLEYVPLPEGVRWADVVICTALLNRDTRGMLNYALLKQAKPGAVLVNVSRGEITPLSDMERLLKEKILGGLGMDVLPEEAGIAEALRSKKKSAGRPIQIIRRLKNSDQVIFTPHNAFNTRESVEQKAKESVQSLVYFFKEGKFPHPVPDA